MKTKNFSFIEEEVEIIWDPVGMANARLEQSLLISNKTRIRTDLY